MKSRLVFILLLVTMFASCKSSTGPIANAVFPSITAFSPDTAWTFKELTIYGNNFGYDYADVPVTVDTAPAKVTYVADTVMRIIVPEYARTGFIYVTKLKQTAKSAKQVVVNYSFNPHAVYYYDSVPLGASFFLPGTGLLNHRGPVKLLVNGIIYPVDSISDVRIFSHVPVNGSTGNIKITDDDATFDVGTLVITRYTIWRTLSAIWDNLVVNESHHRTGYVNGPANSIDSTWVTTATYTKEIDYNISDAKFSRTERGLDFAMPYSLSIDPFPNIQMSWDTIAQSAMFELNRENVVASSDLHQSDSTWESYYDLTAIPLPVDRDLDVVIPDFRIQIEEDSTDHLGLVKWHEETNSTTVSGTFHLKFSH